MRLAARLARSTQSLVATGHQSPGRQAPAVHRECLPGNIRARWGRKKCDGRSNLIRVAVPFHGYRQGSRFQNVIDGGSVVSFCGAQGPRGEDGSRADRVHGDSFSGDVDSQRPRESNDSSLRCRIGTAVRETHQSSHRGDVDDPAPFMRAHRRNHGTTQQECTARIYFHHQVPRTDWDALDVTAV